MPNAIVKILFLLATCAVTLTSEVKADEIDDFIRKTMVQRHIPGLQLAIVKDQEIVKSANYGFSNLQDDIAVSDETAFPINSMTKLFTGVAIMQLVEQGKLSITDEISKHLPDLPQQWRAVTVQQLLSHTSGLPDIMSGHLTDLIVSDDPQQAWTKVQTLPMEFETNTRFSYNQTGYILLGKIIDRLAEQPFVDFITAEQLNKLTMPITRMAGFGYFQYVVKHQARQYSYSRYDGLEVFHGEFAPMLRTAAGMSSTAQELAHYAIALQQGKLLRKPDSLSTLWTPAVLKNGQTQGFNSLENGYALGWQVLTRPQHRAVSASGANANTLIIYPEDDLVIVVLTNLTGALPIEFVDEIAGFYIPEMKEENGWGMSADFFQLYKALQSTGFDEAITAAKQLEKRGVKLDVDELNSWGYRFISQQKTNEALQIFKLNVYLFPKVANTFDSLGELYAILGDNTNAIKNYQKVLELAPQNQNAKSQIEFLKQRQKR